jgi:hypothetical protein
MIGAENRKSVVDVTMLSRGKSLSAANQVQDTERAWQGIEYRVLDPEAYAALEEEVLRDCTLKRYRYVHRIEFL